MNLRRWGSGSLGGARKCRLEIKLFSGKLLEIHKNERCKELSSREWERIRSASQTGGRCVELEEVLMLKSV